MTKLVEEAVAAISALPPDTQDDLARFMLALADDTPLTAAEAAALAEAEDQIVRGQTVPPDVIAAFWRKHGL